MDNQGQYNQGIGTSMEDFSGMISEGIGSTDPNYNPDINESLTAWDAERRQSMGGKVKDLSEYLPPSEQDPIPNAAKEYTPQPDFNPNTETQFTPLTPPKYGDIIELSQETQPLPTSNSIGSETVSLVAKTGGKITIHEAKDIDADLKAPSLTANDIFHYYETLKDAAQGKATIWAVSVLVFFTTVR